MGSLTNSLHKQPIVPEKNLLNQDPDPLEQGPNAFDNDRANIPRGGSKRKAHTVDTTEDESLAQMAVRMNRALRDKRIMRPGVGRWVEYITPDLRRIYVEANLRKAYLGRAPSSNVTARVVIKPGGMQYTNDLKNLMMMKMVEVSGDLVDVARTADIVGIQVDDPETQSKANLKSQKRASLSKQAVEATNDPPRGFANNFPGAASSLLSFPNESTYVPEHKKVKRNPLLRKFRRRGISRAQQTPQPSVESPPNTITYQGDR